ncbi:glycoside hydrolase family 16 protein [Kalaharituber pfeilii]|nr:glycoside hydrolase family 16 protein [Kalaharituber pfeilii]
MYWSRFTAKVGVIGTFIALARLAVADCECGYSVNKTTDVEHLVFTDLLESDFTTLKNIKVDQDWVLQDWKVDKNASRGPYGRETKPENAVSNPAKDLNISDEGVNGRQAGLELYVRKVQEGDEYVSVVEADSYRSDMMYGSFRAGLKTTGLNGTCGAFFWYLNDTQEIDMEFLSSQFNDTTSPVNLVLHSVLSLENGGDASGTPTFKVIQLPFEADKGVHEYRFDWQPDKVTFYADGKWIADMTDKRYIPSAPGKIVISHWSNGHPHWSAGPPEEDAIMLVQYVKAYFNTTSEQRAKDHAERCIDPTAPNAICQIPDQKGPPKLARTPGEERTYFFSQDPGNNKTVDQPVWGDIESGRKSSAPKLPTKGVYRSIAITIVLALLSQLL